LHKYLYLAAKLNGEIFGYACAGAFSERAAYD
jgi:L-amino acid N-acyltransferase YncA